MRHYDLRGKQVFVTGAASGIGRELARRFAEVGARCLLHALPEEREKLEELSQELAERHGADVRLFYENFIEEGSLSRLYWKVKETAEIDVLVNNAGMMAYGEFHRVSLDRHEALVRVNLGASMALMRHFLPDMVARGEGRILNVCSASAFQPCPRHAVYGATKAFINVLTEALARELRGTGVVVTSFCPSYTDTPLLQVEGFPRRVRWYRFSGLARPEAIAREGVRALVKGKVVYMPGLKNRLVHLFLNRVMPRRLVYVISDFVLRGEGSNRS